MPRIVPFQECVARPNSLLSEHLIEVKQAMEYFLQKYEPALVSLAGLAGICHDLAKSHARWQEYISNESIKKGPNHSACGAFFFSYFGYRLLQKLNAWDDYCIHWLWLIRDITDHHSGLDQLTNDNWLKRYDWSMFDLSGIETFIHKHYEALQHAILTEHALEMWIDEAEEIIEEVIDNLYDIAEHADLLSLKQELQTWRTLTTSLIASDRFDVKQVSTSWLNIIQHQQCANNIDEFCKTNNNHPLSSIRMNAQKCIFRQLEEQAEHRFYTLDMPTGYGKTLTSLKMATWFGEKQGYKKIVYVAPYLSILEQTSQVIEKAMGESVLEHHSLALLDESENQRVAESQLAMEAWAHSIVCTSFQQFSKAIFPSRAQDVLRRAFLKDAVIIIDEPQIFSPEVWNLFLCGIESLAFLLNLKVIFLSATMPPFHYGLTKIPHPLQVKASSAQDRYQLQIESRKDEYSIALYMQENERTTQAAILNTIEDAYQVYKHIESDNRFLLHGLMTPLHKKVMIEKVRLALKKKKEQPLFVISTQVIEAGVDVSFEHVARALPILPSIVQAAGRVNRHQEGKEKGLVSIFPFFRHGEKDTRSFIYPKALQTITDSLLKEKETWLESELAELVKEYYLEMFRQNTYEADLMKIKKAYLGDWRQLAEFGPFKKDYLTLPLFIPFDIQEQDAELIPKKVKYLQSKFQVFHGYSIYERYKDFTYMKKLSFEERKQFMILFNFYVLNLPVKKAIKVISKEDYLEHRIPILLDTEAYDNEIGFKASYEEYDENIF